MSVQTVARETIVIVGTGWCGYNVSQNLDEKKFDIIVISPEDTSPYTPLLASAACGLFDFSLAEEPIRHKSKRMQYYKARVENVDFARKVCKCRSACDVDKSQENGGREAGGNSEFDVPYDRLILAPGCTTNTFNTPGADQNAYFVRNVADAKRVQYRIKELLELASIPGISEAEQRGLLHVCIVGGGPTGVALAAELSDLFNDDFTKLFPNLAGKFRITIHDAAAYILGAFEKGLRDHALGSFGKRGVDVRTESKIKNVERDSITTQAEGKVPCGIVIWTAGNKHNALLDRLDVSKTDGLARIMTDEYLHALDLEKAPYPDVYALGDAADIRKHFLPTTAEVAVQKSDFLVKSLNRDSDGKHPFRYQQKGLVTYIGGHDGVVQGSPDWSGGRAWAAWRGKNLLWTRSWRRKFMITAYWTLDWFGGKEIARL